MPVYCLLHLYDVAELLTVVVSGVITIAIPDSRVAARGMPSGICFDCVLERVW